MNVETATYKLEMLMAYLAQTFPVATQCQPTTADCNNTVGLGGSDLCVLLWATEYNLEQRLPNNELRHLGSHRSLWAVACAAFLLLLERDLDRAEQIFEQIEKTSQVLGSAGR